MVTKYLDPVRPIASSAAKAVSPSVYEFLRRRYMVFQFPKQLKSGPPLTLKVGGRHLGMFGLLHIVVGVIHFSMSKRHNVEVEFEVGPYIEPERGDNWWSYYFEPSRLVFSDADPATIETVEIEHVWMFARYGRSLPIRAAARALSNVSVKDHIREKADVFAGAHFQDGRVVGVHYRGTDKVDQADTGRPTEAVRVPYDYVFSYLDTYESSSRFFAASDETEFVDAMTQRFGDRVLSYDAIRSQGGWGIHYEQRGHSPYKAGEDALVDCLLLSKCDDLVRTESALSRFSNILNPALRPTNLTDRYVKGRK